MVETGDPVRIGVVGVGVMGERHVRTLMELPGTVVSGVYDSNAMQAAIVAERFGIHAYDSPEALYSDSHAACIAAATHAHADLALLGLDHGVHLLIEKPLAADILQAQRIVERASRTATLTLAVGHSERFNPTVIELKRIVGNRHIQRMTLRRMSPPANRCLDTDVVHDLMIHDIDLALDFCGDDITEIDATGATASGGPIDEAIASLTLEGGVNATLIASRIAGRRVRTIDVRTDDAWITADLLSQTVTEALLASIDYADSDELIPIGSTPPVHVYRVAPEEPLRRELEHFLDSIRRRSNPEVDLFAGFRAMICAASIIDVIRRTVVIPEAAETSLAAT